LGADQHADNLRPRKSEGGPHVVQQWIFLPDRLDERDYDLHETDGAVTD